MTQTFFLFGAGYSGRAFARAAIADGHTVFGTTRRPENVEVLQAIGIETLLFDGVSLTDVLRAALVGTTHLIVSVAPNDEGDPVLEASRSIIGSETPNLRWVGYLSTVGVYGDHAGAWVDETSQCRPASKRSLARVNAENAWQDCAAERDVPLAILRLSGIYGPGRNALVNLHEGKARRIIKPGQVFNRIHVEDIAGALMLLSHGEMGGVFNVADDEPAPPQDVVVHAAGLMDADLPPETPFDAADMTPMARSFYGENKRVSNAKLKTVGYEFRFPTYRHALNAMWRDHRWQYEVRG